MNLGRSPSPDADLHKLLHELQVYQTELEMQNEELRRTRQDLESSLERYTSLYDFAPVGYFTFDRDGLIRAVNLAGASLLGVERNRLVSKRFGDFMSSYEVRSVFIAFLDAVFTGETKRVCDVPLLTKDNRSLVVRIEASLSGPRQQECFAAVIDITERKRAVEALRVNQALLDKAEILTQSGCLDWDLKQRKVKGSAGLCRLTGLELGAVNGDPRDFFGTVHPDDAELLKTAIRNAIEVERISPVQAVEFRILRKGETRHLRAEAELIFGEGGPPARMIAAIQDITERKGLEERLIESEKMEAIGRLAGGIAHDFNNMLGPILGYADILATQIQEPEPRRFAEAIVSSAQRAADITAQLLGFARKGKYLVNPMDIHEVIAEVVTLLEHSIDRRIEIKQVLKASGAIVKGDRSQVHNMLLNIAINARDAMPDGGKIVFETDMVECTAARCQELSADMVPGKYVMVSVADTGVGMSPATLSRIFEPFFTTKEKGQGTGMGLASAYGTVTHHGGAIQAKSELGEGATITVLWPFSPLCKEAPRTSVAPPPERGSSRVLVVDDEEMVRNVVADMLRHLGYCVTTCANGFEALAMYEKAPDEFDIIILDMMMPGLNGRSTLAELRKINVNVKVLLSSGYSVEGDAQETLAEGAIGFVQKPYNISELSRQIRETLT